MVRMFVGCERQVINQKLHFIFEDVLNLDCLGGVLCKKLTAAPTGDMRIRQYNFAIKILFALGVYKTSVTNVDGHRSYYPK